MNIAHRFRGGVTAALVLIVVSTGAAQYSGGTGEPNDPYQIATAADIITIRWRRDYDRHFILTADIDLSDHPMDVSRCIESFSGIFDGNGHTISNFTWIGGEGHAGLFSFIRDPNAVIKNLGLVDPNVQTTTAAVGGLVGYLWEGTVQDCYVSGGRIAGRETVGGLVGCVRLAGKITGCHSTAAVSGVSCIGGLVGVNGGMISSCWSVASVSGDFWAVGGLVGRNGVSLATGGDEPGSIRNSYAGGTVRGDTIIGGLVGYNEYSSIADCYSTASVTGNSVVGGLAGEQNFSSIVRAYAIGRVTGDRRAGGLVGMAYESSTNRSGRPIGGSAPVDERNRVEASFWDVIATGLSISGGGEGGTTAEMQTAGTFLDAGWDFVDETANGVEDIWWIDEGRDYPRLWWEPRPPVRLPVIELDAASFDAAIAEGVVLVDFFATWCSHCTTQAPILEEVADRLEGRAQVAKLDVDRAQSVVQRYGVTAIPTLILFRMGTEVKRFVGVTSADVLVAAILAAVESAEQEGERLTP